MKKSPEYPLLTQVRKTTAPVESCDGSTRIENGKLVIVTKRNASCGYEVSTLNGKVTIGIGNRLTGLATCPLTCSADEILIMELRTAYHTYTAFGKNPMELYRKIVGMYNSNAGTKYNTTNLHKELYFDDYHCLVYKANINLIWCDDEYYSFNESNKSVLKEIGDWFSLYRKSTWHPLKCKDYFNQDMK